MAQTPIANIKVGVRSRKDLGDIAGLAKSISEVGQESPIAIDAECNLICGERRLAAVKSLGWKTIATHVLEGMDDAVKILQAERDENVCRKEMTPEELFDMAERMRAAVTKATKDAQREGRQRGAESVNRSAGGTFTALPSRDGKAAEPGHQSRHSREAIAQLGKAVGMSGATYERTMTVVNTARDETAPEPVRAVAKEALADLNAGKTTVNAARKKVQAAKNAAADPEPGAKPATQPEKPDPPAITRRQLGINNRTVLRAANQLAAIPIALDPIAELTLNAEEADRAMADLSAAIHSIKRIVNLIKGANK